MPITLHPSIIVWYDSFTYGTASFSRTQRNRSPSVEISNHRNNPKTPLKRRCANTRKPDLTHFDVRSGFFIQNYPSA